MTPEERQAMQRLTDDLRSLANAVEAAFAKPIPKLLGVEIPGTMRAVYDADDDRIVELLFTPHGGAAGYEGPLATSDEEGWDRSDGGMLNDVNGPFWHAMRQFLARGQFDNEIKWVE